MSRVYKSDNRTTSKITDKEAKSLPRLSLFFFKRPKFTLLIWLILVGFGIACYTTLMQRAGFPNVQAPLSIVNGTYLVNDAHKVDQDIAKPLSKIALSQPNVKDVTTVSDPNTISAIVNYKEGVDAKKASSEFEKAVNTSGTLPSSAKLNYLTIDVSKYTTANGKSYDLLIAFYGENSQINTLVNKAQLLVDKFNAQKLSYVSYAEIVSPYTTGQNTLTNQKQAIQTSFDRLGVRVNGENQFHNAVIIGVKANPNIDSIKLDNQVSRALDKIKTNSIFHNYKVSVTAAFGPQIKQNIGELQHTLLEGLIAVLIVGTILIALRASIMIVLSMFSVLSITIAVLYLIGYTLNVITLFALILGLALIVDDTIIMTEALDAERRRQDSQEKVVEQATKRVSLAMTAATSTAILGFAPLIFIQGILGGFIRPIPVTIITSLVVSLFVALIFIPMVGRWLIIRKNNIGRKAKNPYTVRLQEKFAHNVLTKPLRWADHNRNRLWSIGLLALFIGFSFIVGGAYIFKYLTFNIFPAAKDANQLSVQLTFPAGTDIIKAQAITDQANKIISTTLGSNLKQIDYYETGNTHDASAFIDLTPYTSRSVKAPVLVDELKSNFKRFPAVASIAEQGPGGPPGLFNVLIETPNKTEATELANNMKQFLQGKTLVRPDGTKAHITNVLIANPDSYQSKNNKELVEVSAQFDATDTSTLVNLAQKQVQKQYTNQVLAQYNLTTKNIVFDFGFESENQQSFKSMILAFPILLVIMYILLMLEFRSLLQPILIFMAIPFSFFGITGGLLLTDNPFSFFTLLGCFALIGLSIKNTILLTDYANQGRRVGLGRVEAISYAIEERFRPLIATSATAIIALLPLSLTSPFWESLGYTLIFGLLSSTALVLIVFPYYYLGAEYLRLKISRKGFLTWLIINIVVLIVAGVLSPKLIFPSFVLTNIIYLFIKRVRR